MSRGIQPLCARTSSCKYWLVVFVLLYLHPVFFQLFVNKNSVEVTVIQTVNQWMDPDSTTFGTTFLIWTIWKWQVNRQSNKKQTTRSDSFWTGENKRRLNSNQQCCRGRWSNASFLWLDLWLFTKICLQNNKMHMFQTEQQVQHFLSHWSKF